MLRSGVRICDVCGSRIPKGTKYNKQVIAASSAARFKELNAVSCATYTENSDGTVTLDLCLECRIGMSLNEQTVQ